jgi:hypothetical protein
MYNTQPIPKIYIGETLVFENTDILKNELTYNNTTYGEWTLMNGVTVDATLGSVPGLLWTFGQAGAYAQRTTSLNPNTKYGVLLNVVSNTSNGALYVLGNYTASAWKLVEAVQTGNIMKTFVSKAVISTNRFDLSDESGTIQNGVIKIRDIRIFELTNNPDVDTDFTAVVTQEQVDALYAKYPF